MPLSYDEQDEPRVAGIYQPPFHSGPPIRVGSVVVYFSDRTHNGTTEHPAIVTRVWGNESHPMVNLKVLPDYGGEVFDATSVVFWQNGGWPEDGKFTYRYREV